MSNLKGKTVIVTGANSGIGFVTAETLAKQGAKVVMMCRSAEKGAQAVETIAANTGHAPQLILCDFSKPDDINAAADTFLAEHKRLDILINNAGAYFPKLRHDQRGLEMSIAVNHMGYFHLTQRLLPCIKNSAPGRIVSVASRAHTRGVVHFDDLHFKSRKYMGMSAYSTSKLMNVLFNHELSKRLTGTGITANCLHPGVIGTGFGQDEPGLLNSLMKIGRPLLSTPEDGAKTTLYLATSSEVEGKTGGYYANSRPKRPTRRAQNDADAARLWALSEEWMSA